MGLKLTVVDGSIQPYILFLHVPRTKQKIGMTLSLQPNNKLEPSYPRKQPPSPQTKHNLKLYFNFWKVCLRFHLKCNKGLWKNI